MFYDYLNSPLGKIQITANEQCVLAIDFIDDDGKNNSTATQPNKITKQARKELSEYFSGKRKKFDVPVKFIGSKFEIKVWKALRNIPYGETRAYSEIAKQIGSPKAARAVGLANNRNKIAIIIPCHRVIGKNGKLVGYASGVWRKEKLLELEKRKK